MADPERRNEHELGRNPAELAELTLLDAVAVEKLVTDYDTDICQNAVSTKHVSLALPCC